jgi:hypothetical protein
LKVSYSLETCRDRYVVAAPVTLRICCIRAARRRTSPSFDCRRTVCPRDSSVLLGVGLGRRQQVNAERFERLRLIEDDRAQFLVRHPGELVRGAVLKPVVEACGLAAQILSPNGGAQLAGDGSRTAHRPGLRKGSAGWRRGDAQTRGRKVKSRARVLGEDLLAEREAAAAKAAAPKLGELIAPYLAARQKKDEDTGLRRLRASSMRMVRSYLEVSWQRLHKLRLDEITPKHVKDELENIASSSGGPSADRARAALSVFFVWAIHHEHIAASPTLDIKDKSKSRRKRKPSEAELVQIWQACGDDTYGPIVKLLILTGQRSFCYSPLLALTRFRLCAFLVRLTYLGRGVAEHLATRATDEDVAVGGRSSGNTRQIISVAMLLVLNE